jgi:hypothetical protein
VLTSTAAINPQCLYENESGERGEGLLIITIAMTGEALGGTDEEGRFGLDLKKKFQAASHGSSIVAPGTPS